MRTVYEYQDRGGTPETLSKASPDHLEGLLKGKKITQEQYDIALQIREAYLWVVRPVDWKLSGFDGVPGDRQAWDDKGGEKPESVDRYYQFCNKWFKKGHKVSVLVGFLRDNQICNAQEFVSACSVYGKVNGFRWRW